MDSFISTVISPAPRAEWQTLCDNDPTAALTQEPEWTDHLTQIARWADASRYYETSDGRSFVLPLVRRGPSRGGAFHSSMPAGWGIGGLVTNDPIRTTDIESVVRDLKSLRGTAFRILPNPLHGDVWASGVGTQAMTLPRYSHVLDLEGGFGTVWNDRFSKSGRRTVTKALDGELEIERDTTGRLIPVYRALFDRSIERWAAKSREPRWIARIRAGREDVAGKLEALSKALGDRMITWVASYRGEPAAASIILAANSHFYWRAAMHEEFGPATSASYAIQKLAIEEACDSGSALYYLGESGPSKGLALFKERFGGIGHAYPEVRFERVPMTRANQAARSLVKRAVGYRSG